MVKLLGIVGIGILLSGCATQSLVSEWDAKHIEITNNGFVLGTNPTTGTVDLVIGNQRVNLDSVPVYTVTAEADAVTQFQSKHTEWVDGERTLHVEDTISFCNDTSLQTNAAGTDGSAGTVARTSSGGAALDRCQDIE